MGKIGCLRWLSGRRCATGLALLVVSLVAVQVPVAGALSDGWSVVGSPNNGTGQNQLGGVSCLSPSFCMSVGFRENTKTGKLRTLVESWDGQRWATKVSPNSGSGNNNLLITVSCTSGDFCAAVGFSGSDKNGPSAALVETWDGTSWIVATSADVPEPKSVLASVTCVSPRFCVAAGYYKIPEQNDQPGQYQTLVEMWDGSTWALVHSPDPGADDQLFSVACSSVDFCAAVGSTEVGFQRPSQTLVEEWNGKSWSVPSSPNPGTGNNSLYGVSCTSPKSCTTVGSSYQNAPLVEAWNGTSWTIVTTPNVGQAVLYSVSCTAGETCTAVGNTSSTSGERTLVESWNGSAWSVVTSPDEVGLNNALAAVSCLATGGCTAVGTYDKSNFTFRTLVEVSN